MWIFFVLAYPTGNIIAILIIQGLVLARKRAFVKCISIQNRQKEAIKHPNNIIIFIMFPNFLYSFLLIVIRLSSGYLCFSISYMEKGIKPKTEPIIILIHESCLI